jgi:ketosteroid isomerase-like protein
MSQQNIGLVQSGYAAFGRGDIPGFLSLLDADVEWITPGLPELPTAGTRRGPTQVAEFFGVLTQLIEFEDFEPRAFFADGDRVVVLGTARTRVKGGSGQWLVENWCHVFTIRNGKIVAFFEYLDTAPFAAELNAATARA